MVLVNWIYVGSAAVVVAIGLGFLFKKRHDAELRNTE
jgi:hypothetical protein